MEEFNDEDFQNALTGDIHDEDNDYEADSSQGKNQSKLISKRGFLRLLTKKVVIARTLTLLFQL
jgi:hypothetical protein